MSCLLRKFYIFCMAVVLCMWAHMACAVTPYVITLDPNGGNANQDYLTKVCRVVNASSTWGRPDSGGVCPSTESSYSSVFSLSTNEFPQKYADPDNTTAGYETFLGYTNKGTSYWINSSGDMVHRDGGTYYTLYAWWWGVTGVTQFNVNYYSDGNATTPIATTESCKFGLNSTDCNVLSPNELSLTTPEDKYFDGWFCQSGTGNNCRANRYLPSNYESLGITPYGTGPNSNWPNINLSITRYVNDLRDATGNVVKNMSYEYTGEDTVKLYAGWAPYTATFVCNPSVTSPFISGKGNPQTLSISTYKDNNDISHDIVYGSQIPLSKNIGTLCKSVYYKYDNDMGNDEWCAQYLKDYGAVRANANSYSGGEVGSITSNNNVLPWIRGDNISNIRLAGSCPNFTLYFQCGTFDGVGVPGVAPHRNCSISSSGGVACAALVAGISTRQYPYPEKPYRTDSNGDYMACNTKTLTPTAGTNAGVPQIYDVPEVSTASTLGYGCCEKPQYAEFKGYQVRRNSTTGEILNDGKLVQPGDFGGTNCSVSFDNNTDLDTWQPGCALWPWKGNIYLTAIWEHTPIQITFNHNGANNAENLVNSVWLKYGEGFYLNHADDSYSNAITGLSTIPESNGLVFGGYQYCDENDVCTMVVDSSGQFISGANNLKFTDVDITATAVWVQDYTMQYVCSDVDMGYTFGGTAPVATNPVHYGQSVQLEGDPYNDQDGCRKIWGTTNDADYCDNCFTFGGWTIDAETAALADLDITHNANSTVDPWGRTNTTDWCIISDTGNCAGFADDIFYVRPDYTPKQYNISYMYATGPVSDASANMPANYTYTMGGTISDADQTAPAHATFNGWCTNLNDASTCVAAGQSIAIGNRDHGDKTYYARWSCDAGYVLSYNANNEPVCLADMITCAAGFYLPAGATVCADCIAGGYCPGGEFAFNEDEDQGITVCPTNKYSGPEAAACSDCRTDNGYGNSGDEFTDHALEASCKTTCLDGQCVATARAACANVGAGGWATGGEVSQGNTLECYVCPTGEMTIGHGEGANEAGDCGRILHIGEDTLYLRADRKTEHTLNFKIGDKVYYANIKHVNG